MQATSHKPAYRVPDMTAVGRAAMSFVLLLFLISCVFDPADRLFGLKVWLFLLAWLITLLTVLPSRSQGRVPLALWTYTALFVMVPSLSILKYMITDGSEPFEGFNLMKGYVLISLAPMLVMNRVDLLPRLCAVLTMLALAVIGVFIVLQIEPDFYGALYLFGETTGVVLVDTRDYGSDVTLLQVYFVTSPMLAISIAYFFDMARRATTIRARWACWGLTALNVLGMLLAGTRNNIVISLALPVLLWFVHSRRKALAAVLAATVAALLGLIFINQLQAFFDPTEYSNGIKLAMLRDYANILSNPWTLLFGQGLGAYQFWEAKGIYFYITELTYFELLRNFGLFGATLMLGLLVYPALRLYVANRSSRERSLAVAFGAYLVMCLSNPNLFSSMGILILCLILALIHLPSARHRRAVPRSAP